MKLFKFILCPETTAPSTTRGSFLVQKVICAFLLAGVFSAGQSAQAETYWWAQNGATGGTGAWDLGSSFWRAGSAMGTLGLYGNATTDAAVFTGTAGTVTLANSTNVNANSLTFSSDGYTVAGGSGSTLTLSGTTPTISVDSGSATINAVLAGTGGLKKTGAGTLTLNGSAVNTYTGATNVSGGTLKLDFGNLPTPTNLINSASSLQLNRGTLQVVGNAGASASQTFASTALQSGTNVVSAGTNNPTVALGAISVTVGGSILFTGASTSTGLSSGTTGQTGAAGNVDTTGLVAATATITTTNTGGINGLLGSTSAGAYATVGLYDFAAVSGGTVIGLSQSTAGTTGTATDGGYKVINTGTLGTTNSVNYDVTGTSILAPATVDNITLRFNTATATNMDWKNASNGAVSGILVTPNVGANNVAFVNTTAGNQRSIKIGNHTPGSSQALVIWQNNTSGFLRFDNGIIQGGGVAGVVQNGSGTVVYGINAGAAIAYTAPTFLNGGVAEIASNQGIGDVATAATLNLNGGTLVGTATLALDNAGANQRPVNLQSGGGGLGALTGTTVTVSGVVSGTGPLAIGLAASAVNGNVVGQVPGTGTGTANTTSQIADGTVILSNVNPFTGSTTIYSGTLQISGSLTGTTSVNLAPFTTINLQNNASVNDAATLSLVNGSTLNLNFAIGSETINALFLNGVAVSPNTYTAAQLGALAPSITFSSFGGTLTVLTAVPEPHVCGIAFAGLLAALIVIRRRKTQLD